MNQMEELEEKNEKLQDEVAELKDEIDRLKSEKGASTNNESKTAGEDPYLKEELH